MSSYYLFIYSNHEVTDLIFFMAHCDKITRHEFLFIYFRFCQKQILTPFTMMYMFVHYIYTRYIDAHIHEGLNLRPYDGGALRP
jgi:hypothetical protein